MDVFRMCKMRIIVLLSLCAGIPSPCLWVRRRHLTAPTKKC